MQLKFSQDQLKEKDAQMAAMKFGINVVLVMFVFVVGLVLAKMFVY